MKQFLLILIIILSLFLLNKQDEKKCDCSELHELLIKANARIKMCNHLLNDTNIIIINNE